MIGGYDELEKLFKDANARIQPKYYMKWLAYCLGVMSSKMDKLDFETMREAIKKYEKL